LWYGETLRSRSQGHDRTGRISEYGCRSTGLGDQGVKVFDLPLESVRRGIATIASPSPVIVEYGEMGLEESREGRTSRSVVECANHQDDRGSLS